jgi:hypothetical protein
MDSSESSVSEDEFQDDLLMYTNRAFNQRVRCFSTFHLQLIKILFLLQNEINGVAEDSSNIGSEDEEDQNISFE